MQDRYYPPLPLEGLSTVMMLADEDPGYFTDPKCPYSDEVKALFSAGRPEEEEGADDPEVFDIENVEIDDVINDITDLQSKLKTYESTAMESSAGANTFFRLSFGLLEKIVDLKEKAKGLKQMMVFQQTVMDLLEDEFDTDQRGRFFEKLKRAEAQLS